MGIVEGREEIKLSLFIKRLQARHGTQRRGIASSPGASFLPVPTQDPASRVKMIIKNSKQTSRLCFIPPLLHVAFAFRLPLKKTGVLVFGFL